SWTVDTTKHFVYDGWNVIQEITTAQPTKYYVWGLDLSQSLQGAGGVGGLLAVIEGTSSWNYLYDGNGNVGQMLNSTTGAIEAHYEYDPYGNSVLSTGALASSNPYRFSTKYLDDEFNLYYYGYRYYDPETGRWLNRDPIDEQGGLNLYVLLNNNSINSIDHLGLIDVEACVEVLKSIYVQAGKLYAEIKKYDPLADGKGGFPMGGGKLTKPGGHYKEIKNFQKGLKNRLGDFVKRCIDDCDDDDDDDQIDKPTYPKWADQLSNVSIPEPIYDSSRATKRILVQLPIMPDTESAVVKIEKYQQDIQNLKTVANIATVSGKVTGCYCIYRAVRLLPSLAPPFWWTIPANVVAP
ncbi:MAG: hypothetical protein K8S27_02905, partial [Candidatus Omnitrophica bacterium]|nr:hypothetical protein [Candidatus Omnitrophota bacterium]